jgi:hypothetical protein
MIRFWISDYWREFKRFVFRHLWRAQIRYLSEDCLDDIGMKHDLATSSVGPDSPAYWMGQRDGIRKALKTLTGELIL